MKNNLEKLREENEKLRKEIEDLKKNQNIALTLEEYQRYGRQLIIPEIGLKGQLKLKRSKVLVIGAGGLGCPALAYLAGAGIGTIGIVDNDTVDVSNLHRQILHSTEKVGMLKGESAVDFISKLNPNVKTIFYGERLIPGNSFEIFEGYDLILDCTDTPATRYLINDTAVLLGIPLISASALKTEGQLSILNFQNGPCYRCLFPLPPPPDSVLSCGDGGILGPVVGIMGVMQSIEALKVLAGAYDDEFLPSLTIFSAFSYPQWRYIKMRGRKKNCVVCGDEPTVTRSLIESCAIDYVEFCGRPTVVTLDPDERVSALDYAKVQSTPHTLLDVRETEHYSICSFPGSINLPYSMLKKGDQDLTMIQEPVYVCCRLGNDSQASVRLLKDKYGFKEVWDIKGGLTEWSEKVDDKFPRY